MTTYEGFSNATTWNAALIIANDQVFNNLAKSVCSSVESAANIYNKLKEELEAKVKPQLNSWCNDSIFWNEVAEEFTPETEDIQDDPYISELSLLHVSGNRIELPSSPLTHYSKIKKALLDAGGKYKRNGFDFLSDAQPIMNKLIGGDKINIKKDFQFFETPTELADRMVSLAQLSSSHVVLEPSAGRGALLRSIERIVSRSKIQAVELMPSNADQLEKDGYIVIEGDFLAVSLNDLGPYERIIANPPFSQNQDIDHIRKMYEVLSVGGRLVSIASASWSFGMQKKQIAFREWLNELNAEYHELPAGTFSESGTNVASYLIIIDKHHS